jgi:hypothetical protein
MKRNDKIWVRLGDNAEYVSYNSIEDVKQHFESLMLTKDLERYAGFGVKNSEYKGLNYISLFYGDKVDTPILRISDFGIDYLNK